MCRQKTLSVAHSSYSRRGVLCNDFFTSALDRLFGEALSREVAHSPGPSSALGEDALSPGFLRLEAGECFLDELDGDAPALEIVADQVVAGAAPGEELCAPARQPAVVDRTRAGESFDRLLPNRRRHVPPRKPLLELSHRQIAVRNRTRGAPQRLVLTELAPHPPGPFAIELDTQVEPGTEHDLGR